MTQPGSPASAMPADESSVMRRLADLERQLKELGPSIAESFGSTIEYLQSLISEGDEGTSFDSGPMPGNSVTNEVVPPDPAVITGLRVPTGRLQILSGCGEVSLRPGNGSAIAWVNYSLYGPDGALIPSPIAKFARIFSESNRNLGVSLSVSQVRIVPTDVPITIRGRYHVWSNSSSPLAAATFNDPYLSVQVIAPE